MELLCEKEYVVGPSAVAVKVFQEADVGGNAVIYFLYFYRAAGPLMLSPTGQILAPSSCPPWLLVNFITENMDQAKEMISDYQRSITTLISHRIFIVFTALQIMLCHIG